MEANGIAQAVLFSCLLIAASVWDIRKRIIPDTLCIAIAVIGLLDFSPTKALGILLGLLVLLIAALVKEGGICGGDIKLISACSLTLGLPAACAGIIIGLSVLGFWYYTIRYICKRKKISPIVDTQTALPLVPFLSIGYIAATIIEIIGGTTL